MLYFFITCNRSAEYLTKLLRHLHRADDRYLIHCDRKSPSALARAATRLHDRFDNIDIMPPRAYSWAGFSQVATTLDAIKIALRSGQPWTHFATLSEQHLPTMSPAAMEELLAGRGSLIQMRPVAAMGAGERADVENRSAVLYEEMDGIGSFNSGALPPDDAFVDSLSHGSNWYILSRKHCDYLADLERQGVFERFRHTVHADEHTIQTALSSERARSIDTVENVETTFVALPGLTDNHDLVMCERNFWEAKAARLPFVRKRPPDIPPAIDAQLFKTHDATDIVVDSARDEVPGLEPARRAGDIRWISERLRTDVTRRFRELVHENTDAITQRPLFYEHFRIRTSPFSLYVLSEDLRHYRALIVEQRLYEGFFRAYQLYGFEFALLRVRVHGLFFNREVARIGGLRGKIVLAEESDYPALRESVFEQARDLIALHNLAARDRLIS